MADLNRSLDAAVAPVVAVTVLLFAFDTSSVQGLLHVGAKGRWVALALLTAIALARVVLRRVRVRSLPLAWVLAALIVAVGAESTLWSINVGPTEQRIVTLAILFFTAAALALGGPDPRTAANRVLDGVLAGVALVALGSLVVLLVAHRDAVVPATTASGWRFQGIGENPDTEPMLLAVGFPIALARSLDRDARVRWLGIAIVLLLAGELAASGSRGGLIAAFGGGAVAALALGRSRRAKAALAVGVVALGLLCVGLSRIPGPSSAAAAGVPAKSSAKPQVRHRGLDAEALFPFDGEIGFPSGPYEPPNRRVLFSSSGRLQAWSGAWDQGLARPLLGYGFGSEGFAFADRFYEFESALVENSYLGFFLQLGAVGGLLFLALLVTLAWNGVVAVRRGVGAAGAALGVLAAAMLDGMSQSGLLAVGFVAAAAIWLSVLSLPLLARDAP